MDINKAHWSMEKDHIRLSMPINKVDKERRTVSGFACRRSSSSNASALSEPDPTTSLAANWSLHLCPLGIF